MASVYSSSIYPSPYSVTQADSPPELSNVTNSICHSTNLERAFTEERFANLTRHAKGVDALKAELSNLDTQDIEICFRAISQQDHNNQIFQQLDAGSILIFLYITGEIDKSQYLNFAYLVNFFEQFSDGISTDSEVFNCDMVEVVDLNAPQNQELRDELFKLDYIKGYMCCSDGLKYTSFLRKNSTTPCFFMTAKLTSEQAAKMEEARETDFKGLPKNNPYFALWNFSRIAPAPVEHSKKARVIFIPTIESQIDLMNFNSEAPKMEPFLGSTTADDLVKYREDGAHPIAIFHRTIQNNFQYPHGYFTSKLFSGVHDCGHCVVLSKIPVKYKTLLLDIDSSLMDIKKLLASSKKTNRILKKVSVMLQHLHVLTNGKIYEKSELTVPNIAKHQEAISTYEQAKRPLLDQDIVIDRGQNWDTGLADILSKAIFDQKKQYLTPFMFTYTLFYTIEKHPENFQLIKTGLQKILLNPDLEKKDYLTARAFIRLLDNWDSLTQNL
ncbi:hypothetical protein SOPP22_11515 [Shewanella sp. OPT22]|nr:hypothetical protein SOPP22_11515 [Shewanella sp. OPT22]